MAGSAPLLTSDRRLVRSERLSSEHAPRPTISSQTTLQAALHARRADFIRPRHLKIKIGTWNVAGHKGVEKDLGAWFTGGAGIAENLLGLSTKDESSGPDQVEETTGHQEARVKTSRWFKRTTLPKHDRDQVADSHDVGLYVLGLQEIVDINSATEALRPFADNSAAKKFKQALEKSLPPGYVLVCEQQLIGLLLLVYAAPAIAPEIRSVSTTSVGTGLMGYMGNKGAVTARIVIGETTRLVFVNSHMSAGTGKAELERRNWDYSQIVNRTKFDPIIDSMGLAQTHGEQIGDEDVAFWFGDLNYRLEGVPPEDVRRLLMMHTRDEYEDGERGQAKIDEELSDTRRRHSHRLHKLHRHKTRSSTSASHGSSVSTTTSGTRSASSLSSNDSEDDDDASTQQPDPASLQATVDSLLPHDELTQQRKIGKAFADWREGKIAFLPSFKYDVGSVGVYDSSEKKRGPSWCDRILYRTTRDRDAYQAELRNLAESRKRDVSMKAQGLEKAAIDEELLFDYDPDADGGDDEDGHEDREDADQSKSQQTSLVTKEGFNGSIELESYISHMRVLSSDHKPLDAVFNLQYDAVDHDLKRKVHAEVAREIDKMENEGRPVLTIVGDVGSDENNLDQGGLNFRGVRYHDPKVRAITIANTGKVDAYFGFAARPIGLGDKSQVVPEWLQFRVERQAEARNAKLPGSNGTVAGVWSENISEYYLLQPGEACGVELVAVVNNKELVGALNDGQLLEDVLILRIRDGRDHFLPVRGVWKHSSHGRALDAILRVPEGGFRKLQHQQPHGGDNGSSPTDGHVSY